MADKTTLRPIRSLVTIRLVSGVALAVGMAFNRYVCLVAFNHPPGLFTYQGDPRFYMAGGETGADKPTEVRGDRRELPFPVEAKLGPYPLPGR